MGTRAHTYAWMLFLFVGTRSITAAQAPSLMDVLQGREVTRIELAADLSRLMSHIQNDEWVPAQIAIRSGTAQYTFQGRIRLRGRFRRMNCHFPPIKLKIPKSQLAACGLDTRFNNFKIVTHCLEDRFAGNHLVLREYIAYRLYQALTPKSYRTQLARMTWIDTGKDGKKLRRLAFLIEETDELAARMKGVQEKRYGIARARLSPNDTRLMILFQQLIGNDDWDLDMARNIKYIYVPENDWYVPIPYDFDFSTFVAAPYYRSIPRNKLPPKDQTLYKDLYHSHVARYLLAKRQELAQIISANKFLPDSEKELLYLRLMSKYKELEYKMRNPKQDVQKSAAIVE